MRGPKHAAPPPADALAALAPMLAPLAKLLAGMVAAELAPLLGQSPHYDQHTAPAPLTKRAYLDAARRGDFPSVKRGQIVLAERTAVDAWIAAGRPRANATASEERSADPGGTVTPELMAPATEPTDEAILAHAGVRLTRGARRGT